LKPALRFVLLVGVVNLFADMTYEGGRGEVGAFLGHLGATGLVVGLVAGGSELAGYAIRAVSGRIADRTGSYWAQTWFGYAVNMLCVPALALAGSLPVASALVVGERFGRGVRKPLISSFLASAGKEIGGGWAFGLNQALDQAGATIGPLIVAFFVARGGFQMGFAVLIVPAVLTLAMLVPANLAAHGLRPSRANDGEEPVKDVAAFRRYAAGGALFALGYVDFALIAYRFGHEHIGTVALISVWFAIAMGVAAITAPIVGKLYDRFGNPVVGITLLLAVASVPLAFLFSAPWAFVGAALWGLGSTVEDALLLAIVARVIGESKRATAFGNYYLVFGVAWLIGSAICGFLVDRSIPGLVAFSVIAQLLAIPTFRDIRPA
jgi:MFS family permease